MIVDCRRPVLILEGPGDVGSVPQVLRLIAHSQDVFNFNCSPHPLTKTNLPKLAAPGALEKFVGYADSRDDGDSVLVCVDSDGHCPKTAAGDFVTRLNALHLTKKVGLCFFHCEFEALYITCLDLIAAKHNEYGWTLDDWSEDMNAEEIGGAKGWLSRHMKKGRRYKETTDQARFVSCLDPDRLRAKSRAYRHLEKTLRWLVGLDDHGGPRIAPFT